MGRTIEQMIANERPEIQARINTRARALMDEAKSLGTNHPPPEPKKQARGPS